MSICGQRLPAYRVDLESCRSNRRAEVSLSTVLSDVRKWMGLRPGQLIVVYHQSAVTVPSTPHDIPCVVTHHAPMVHDVLRRFGPAFAQQAYQGDDGKVSFLGHAQRLGLDYLAHGHGALAVELSEVQGSLVVEAGVPRRRTLVVPPPYAADHPSHRPGENTWASRDRVLFTAAARIDGFKRLESMADAFADAARGRPWLYLRMFVGASTESEARSELVSRIPLCLRRRVRITPRLSERVLNRYMSRSRRAAFVFPSIYETLGITALQAATWGMPLIMRGIPAPIGAREYIRGGSCYGVDDDDSLASEVRNFADTDAPQGAATTGLTTRREFAFRTVRRLQEINAISPPCSALDIDA